VSSLLSAVIESGDIPPTGETVYRQWTNPTHQTLRISMVHLGADIVSPQGRGNVHVMLKRTSDEMMVANDRWNFYGPQNTWISSRTTFMPHWVELKPGDSLILWAFYKPVSVSSTISPASSARAKAHIWWTYE
jgi:hypothetical protein